MRTLWGYAAGADFGHRRAALSEGICPECRGRLEAPRARTDPADGVLIGWCKDDGLWVWSDTRVEWTQP